MTFDVTDLEAVNDAVRHLLPTAVIHLAAVAAPMEAQQSPRRAWEVNVDGTRNVVESVLRNAPGARFVYVGSAESYGASFRETEKPLDENALLKPMSVYGATKAAADIFVGQMAYEGLNAVRFRPFNHTGPGQSDAYVVSAFARQIAEITQRGKPPIIRVGNLSVERDFLDVRDIVRAYADAALNSFELRPGLVFNLASGIPRSIQSILDALIKASGIDIQTQVDPDRMRGTEVARVVGNAAAARRHLGWQPLIKIEDTLLDVLNDWQARLSQDRPRLRALD
jgi:GDP-4-dehydro-6-deoxy-D-mannose reductase